MRMPRILHRTFLAIPVSAAVLAAACGGGAAPASLGSPTVTPATSAPATAAPATAPATTAPPASPSAPPQAGVGAAVVKLSESKQVANGTPVQVSFFGDEPGLAAGTYVEILNLVTLQPGGRTISHKHGGLEIVVVIEGSVEVRLPAGKKVMLAVGQTAKVPANTAVQAANAGTGVAKFLAFFVTAEGQPFQTNLDVIP